MTVFKTEDQAGWKTFRMIGIDLIFFYFQPAAAAALMIIAAGHTQLHPRDAGKKTDLGDGKYPEKDSGLIFPLEQEGAVVRRKIIGWMKGTDKIVHFGIDGAGGICRDIEQQVAIALHHSRQFPEQLPVPDQAFIHDAPEAEH